MESNSSEFNIIFLKQAEIDNPLSVLDDFFSDDWLPGHLERLKEWRRCIIADDYFKGDTGSPGALLYFYKLNVYLLEASSLLKDAEINISGQLFPNQLLKEKENWRDFPTTLDEKLLLKPELYLAAFFKDFTLQQYREILYEWLEYGLSAITAQEFIDAAVLIKVYENLQVLYNIAWVVHQRTSGEPYLKNEPESNIVQSIEKSPGVIYKLNHAINPKKQALLSEVVSIIKHKVPSTEAIIYLGINPAATGRHFLLVLTANEEKETAQSLRSCIEESCAKVTVYISEKLTTQFRGKLTT